MSHRYIALVLLVTLTAFSGCVEDGSPQPHAVDDAPEEGRFLYEGDAGTQLRVLVTGTQVRADTRLRPQDTLVLEYRVKEPRFEHDAVYEEAVSLMDGLVVQQSRTCLPRKGCEDSDPLIYFASSGLPAVLGMGPLWSTGGFYDGMKIQAKSEIRALDHLELDVSPAVFDGRECHKIRYNPGLEVIRLFQPHFPGPLSYAVVCPGFPMPVAFEVGGYDQPGRLETFTLVDSQAGGRVEFGEGFRQQEESEAPLVRMQEWNATGFRYFFDDSEFINFSLPEAHEQAMKLDDRYRNIIGQEDPVMLSNTYSGLLGTLDPGVLGEISPEIGGVRIETYERSLIIDDSSGPPRLFVIQKEVRDPEGDPEVRYRMAEPDDGDLQVLEATRNFRLDELPLVQAEPLAVAELYEDLHAEIPDRVSFGHRLARTDQPNDPTIQLGYQVRLYKLLDQTPEGSGAIGVTELSVDGPSGTVLRMSYPRERMPLDDPLGLGS